MKKIYEEFLRIPKDGKIREKVFTVRIALSMVGIIFCMAMMGFTAYAYFSCSITSGITTIRLAHYSLDVDVNEVVQTKAKASENQTFTPDGEGFYVFENVTTEEKQELTDKTYEFTMSVSDSTTASVGFAKIEVVTDANADGEKQVYYTTPIGIYVEGDKTVENKEYKMQIRVPAYKTVKVKVIPEWGTCAKETLVANGDTLVPQFVDSKYIHIVFDDVTNSLMNLKKNEYKSLYEEPFFAWLKSLHDTYDAQFSLYTYVNVLEQVPDSYKAEFASAREWLKIGLQAETSSGNTELKAEVWNSFATNVYRITGTYESIDRMPKLENSAGSKEVLIGMRDADMGTEQAYGALGFLADSKDDNTYYLNEENCKKLYSDDFYIDSDNKLVFVAMDLQFGKLSGDEKEREKEYEKATSLQSCIAFAHEGQFYNEGGFIQDEDGETELLKKQVEELCKYAATHEIQFKYPQTRDFDAIEEIKVALAKIAQKKADAQKAAEEKAADEKAAKEKAAQEGADEADQEATDKAGQGATSEEKTTDTNTSSGEQTEQEATSQNDGE